MPLTYTDSASLHARKTTNDVLGIVGHDFSDHTFIHYLLHYLQHVVRHVGIVRHLETVKQEGEEKKTDAVRNTQKNNKTSYDMQGKC